MNIFFIGIGGISMSGLAIIAKSKGHNVSGSDKNKSEVTDNLSKKGINVYIGHNKEHITENLDIIVYTAAISKENEELKKSLELAKENKVKVYERSTFLGKLMDHYENSIAISGTHGKTTTTSITSHIFKESGLNPNILVGGINKNTNSNVTIGNSNYFITEACEYVDSFLKFFPKTIVITNIEKDHLDYFKNIENIKKSFYKFNENLKNEGTIIANGDDVNVKDALKNSKNKIYYLGFNEDNDFVIKNVIYDNFSSFDLYFNKNFIGNFKVNLVGKHNIYNSAFSVAVAFIYKIDVNLIKKSLLSFKGVKRRFEYIGKKNNITIYDDYAHHPTEIIDTIIAAKEIKKNKLVGIFQPHTYSRTKTLFNEFKNAFFGLDTLILVDIYAAREIDDGTVSSKLLAEEINKEYQLNKEKIGKDFKVVYMASFEDTVNYLNENLNENDIVCTIGAGDVYKIGKMFLKEGENMNLKDELAKIIKNNIDDLTMEEIKDYIEIPPDSNMGDFSFLCFKLAKKFRKSPMLIAEDLKNKIETSIGENTDFITKIEIVSGYLNFHISPLLKAKITLNKVLNEKENYEKKDKNNENIIVEYSSPNIAKPFHIGHIRTTVIGSALYNLYKYMGYNVIGINHLGDYGTQFGKLIVAYKKWGNREELNQNPIKYLLKLYVKFHDEAEKDESLNEEARKYFTLLENNDEESVNLWKTFKDESLKEFSKIYKLLNIDFDSYAGESFYSDKMDSVIEELNEKHLLKESEGAKIVDLEEENLGAALIQKSDGSTLYLTRDLAAAIYRNKTYNFKKCIYVVGSQQILHFKQVKAVLKKMGYDFSDNMIHVTFGMVSLEGGDTLSTRKGKVVFLEDVLNSAIEKTKTIIEEKNPNLKNIDQLAKEIGVGAVVFQELSTSRNKDYSFSLEKTLSFEGETGPYVQYTHARCCSVLRNAKGFNFEDADFKTLIQNQDAMDIVKILSSYSDVLKISTEKNEPHHIGRYVLDLSKAFNKFYHQNKIIVDDVNIKKDRLALTNCVIYAIRSALSIFNIETPEEM